jgi:hypothetical protein
MHIMGILSRHGHAKRRREHFLPTVFARVSFANQEPFIMRMTAEWFKAAKAHMDSPSLGRSVHHVKGHRVQSTLNSQVHPKCSTPKDWKFEVLTKIVVVQKHKIASKEWLAYARAFLSAWLTAIYTLRIKEGPISENKGCTPRNRKTQIHQ